MDFKDIVVGKGLSLIAQSHIRQIGTLMIKQGIELSASADDAEKTRTGFIQESWRRNQTALHLFDIWEKGAKGGSILLYIRPNGRHYRLHYYDSTQFLPYFDGDGDLIGAKVKSSHIKDGERIYTQFEITLESFKRWTSVAEIDLQEPNETIKNPYGFLPLVLINNESNGIGKLGKPEFDDYEKSIEEHDWLLNQVHGNLSFFGSPIVYTSRSAQELKEAGIILPKTAAPDYTSWRNETRIALKKIFDNFEAGDVIGFATPEPVDPESIRFIDDYSRQIRTAMGSVDEKQLSGSQFTIRQAEELALSLAFAIATSIRKTTTYFTYGIAHAYSLLLQMAEINGIIEDISSDKLVNWRHLGDIWKKSSKDVLNDSIVARNLLRLGVNPIETLRFLFPEKRQDELEDLARDGFAYEFISAIANVAVTLKTAQLESGDYAFDLDQFIQEVLDARPSNRIDPGNSRDTSDTSDTSDISNGRSNAI